jgi:nitroreductase/NAD-dependent dihydropyrimidine dehydrogenase PreA subunit
MALIQVNVDRCKRDGICIETCPLALLEFKTKDAFPTLIKGGEALCIQCGHCVAVCPHQAMDHAAIPASDCPPLSKEQMISSEQAEQFLRMRRSIRVYKNKPVDRGLLTKLIEVARYAPSGHNTQPVEWRVVDDKNQIHTLAGVVIDWMGHLVEQKSPLVQMLHMDRIIQTWQAGKDRILRDAPHLIITHAPQELRTAQSSSTIALAYLELMAPALGLGACWAGYFMAAASAYPPMTQTLKLPQGHAVFGAVMVGYPKFRYHRLPLRKEPKITWQSA